MVIIVMDPSNILEVEFSVIAIFFAHNVRMSIEKLSDLMWSTHVRLSLLLVSSLVYI